MQEDYDAVIVKHMLSCFGSKDCTNESRQEKKFNEAIKKGEKEITRTNKEIDKQTTKLKVQQEQNNKILKAYDNAFQSQFDDAELSDELRQMMKGGGNNMRIAFLVATVVGMSILGSITA